MDETSLTDACCASTNRAAGRFGRASLLIPALLALLLGLAFQGRRGLYGPDEDRYVESAREMLVSGDWLTPRLNGELYLSKPPLTHWAIAAGMALFGQNEFGARFFHAVFFAATTLLITLLGKLLWDETTGILSGVVYATSVLPFAAANIASTDCPLTFFETLAVLLYWHAVRADRETARSRFVCGMWVALGLAFMTKGHAALVPLLPIVLWHVLQKRRGTDLPRLLQPLGLTLFGAIGLWWFALMSLWHEGALDYFLVKQVAGHMIINIGGVGHNKQWYQVIKVYGSALTVGFLPWLAVLPVWLWRLRRRGKRINANPQTLFVVMWFAVPLTVFVLMKSRMPLYLLPLFVPLALGVGRCLALVVENTTARSRTIPLIALGLWCVALLTCKWASSKMEAYRDSRAFYRKLERLFADGEYDLYFLRRPKFGVCFYCRRLAPETAIEERSIRPLLPEPYCGEEFADKAKSVKRSIFLGGPRLTKQLMDLLRRINVPFRIHDGPARWTALEVVAPAEYSEHRR